VFWGTNVQRSDSSAASAADLSVDDYVARGHANPDDLLKSLTAAVKRLHDDFGSWETPWGEINRFQRISSEIGPHFDDTKHSIPVPFASSRWGALASFGARPYPNTRRWYGTSGNSFIAVVEFGDRVRARAVTAGGESGHIDSPHFSDQATAYSMGALRDVYFYPDEIESNVERKYRPGQ
jgi:acyl-homoserine-lactone acylase